MKRQTIYAAIFTIGLLAATLGFTGKLRSQSVKEAPTGYNTPTMTNNPGSQSVSNGMPQPANDTFAEDQAAFEEEDGVDKGLGPIYNARSCSECHQNPVTGGGSQVSELRVGHNSNGRFVNPSIQINDGATTVPNRSLINDRSICAQAQERVPSTETIHTFRMSLNTLGDGFVEAIPDSTLLMLAAQESAMSNGRIHGEAIKVPMGRQTWRTLITSRNSCVRPWLRRSMQRLWRRRMRRAVSKSSTKSAARCAIRLRSLLLPPERSLMAEHSRC